MQYPENATAKLKQCHSLIFINHLTPWMLQHLTNTDPLIHIAIQHQTDQINACLAHDIWHPQVVVANLVYAIERVLLVDNGIQ